MMTIMTTIIMSMTITIALMAVCYSISKKLTLDREKMSPFECGFDPLSSPRTPMSIQFFLIATLFLIFDVEIVLLLPMIVIIKSTTMKMWFSTCTLFILILLMGLYHEWYNNMLEWPM